MDTSAVLFSLRNAAALLRNADNELMRPEEDAVLLCGCHNTKNAVIGFLKTFLAENQVDDSSNSIEKLMARSRHLEPGFYDIDISCFECRIDERTDCYCLDENKVRECFIQAKSIEKTVLSSLQVSSADLY